MFDNMQADIDKFMESMDEFIAKRKELAKVEEEDFCLEWGKFHAKYPKVSKEEYEMGVKAFQEM